MGSTYSNNTVMLLQTTLVFFLIFLPYSAPRVVSRAGSGATQTNSSDEKKPNVGAVVGLTFLLVFIIAAFLVFVYWKRRSGPTTTASQGVGNRLETVVPPGTRKEDFLPKQRVEVPVAHDQVRIDDKKQVEGCKEVNKPPNRHEEAARQHGNGDGKEGKKAAQDDKLDRRGQRDKNDNRERREDKKGRKERNQPPNQHGEAVKQQGNGDGNQGKKPAQDAELVGLEQRDKDKNKGKQLQHNVEEVVQPNKGKEIKGKGKQPAQDDIAPNQKKRAWEGQQPPLDDRVEKKVREENQKVGGEGEKKPMDVRRPREVVIEQEYSLGLLCKYPYKYLLAMTKNFDFTNKIGGGTFGNVYRGTHLDGTMVAVKCLKYGGLIDDFKNEVQALSRANHSNLVKLIGYCDESIIKILIYEYMSNGSLDKWIFHTEPTKFLTWPEMKNVIQGIARGLVYLHEKCNVTILHRDLKPQNVILDDNKNAKLCDFGLAKLVDKGQTSTSATSIVGTPGYMAPEILKGKNISDKVDVYSFGIVVLEVVFGKQYSKLVTSDKHYNSEEVTRLHDYLINNLSEDIRRNSKEIRMFVELAMSCIQEKPEERPTMLVVLAVLRRLRRNSIRRKPQEAEV